MCNAFTMVLYYAMGNLFSHLKFDGLQSKGIIKTTVPIEQDILIGAIFTTVDSNNLSTTVNITALYNFHTDYSEDISVSSIILFRFI